MDPGLVFYFCSNLNTDSHSANCCHGVLKQNIRMATSEIFFFPAEKSFIVSIWSKAWERAPGWLEGCLMTAGRSSGTKPTPQGYRGAPQKTGLQRLLVMLEASLRRLVR